MTWLLYPSLQAPVLTADQQPEQVTESRWHQPFSQPSFARVAALAAIVLAASSGNTFNPLSIPNSNPGLIASTWFAPLSEPVRVPLRLQAGLNQYQAFTEAEPFPESVTESRWHQAWSEPVRVPLRLGAELNPFYTAPVNVDSSVIAPTAWFNPFTDPVRVPLRLHAALNQFQPENPWGLTQPETTTIDRYLYSFSEPVRHLPRLEVELQSSAVWGNAGPYPEEVTESRWHQAWSEPVRIPARLITGAQQAFWVGAFPPFPETVTESRWHQAWSEPVRVPARLHVANNPYAAFQDIVPQLVNNSGLVMKNSIVRIRLLSSKREG